MARCQRQGGGSLTSWLRVGTFFAADGVGIKVGESVMCRRVCLGIDIYTNTRYTHTHIVYLKELDLDSLETISTE